MTERLIDRPTDTALRALSSESMAGLRPLHRTVLFLRVGLGWNVNRTAAAMGTSPDAIRLMQHRALDRLREELGRSPLAV
ncbi:sigma factor-like helix-turn-helix DNA-binding protein [Nocardia sp. NPDC127526]|uniref:sigma factor-like helix-turn-helix DNA-binding protein n=1 Tax=Nocardia sp. NPDC127526 TaxID=3345393 RepID=UPI00363F8E43